MKNKEKYVFSIPIRSGRTASDLLLDGAITPTDFGIHHILSRESKWGYIGKVNRKPWAKWAELFGMKSGRGAKEATKRLVDTQLVYIHPPPKKHSPEPPAMLVFEESLTKEEQSEYFETMKANGWDYVKEKSDLVEFTAQVENIPDTPTGWENCQRVESGNITYFWDGNGTYGKKYLDERDARVITDVPQFIKDMFTGSKRAFIRR